MPIRQSLGIATGITGTYGSPYISDHLATDTSNIYPPSTQVVSAALSVVGPSTHTFRPRRPAARALGGMVAKSYADDMYNRIYISPSSISVGNVLGKQERTVSLWNAYLYEQRTLSQAEVTGDSGAYATLPAGVVLPYEVQSLEELLFTVTVDLAGPPNIDAVFTVTVEGEQYEVPITGRRIVLFPFAPNWSAPVDETVTFDSWVIPAVDGSEQTGSKGGGHAIRTFEYQTVLKTVEEMQRAENLLFTWQGRFFALPIWTERRTLAAAASGDTLSFDTDGFSVEPGSLLVLWSSPTTVEIKEVESFTSSGVVLSSVLESSWPQGTVVYPLAIALSSEQISGSRETTGIVRLPVMFECEPSTTPGNVPSAAAPTTYRGDELYLGPINWNGAQPMSYTSDRKKLDFGTLKFSSHTHAGFSKYSRSHDWFMEDEADKTLFREFLGRRQGMARPVWMPSGVNDFTLAQDAVGVNSFIVVKANEYDNLIAQHPARRDIIIHMWDGTYLCRRIISSALGPQGVMLTLDDTNGSNFTPDDVKRISYLTQYRLASPAVTIRHITDSVAVAEASVVARRPKGA